MSAPLASLGKRLLGLGAVAAPPHVFALDAQTLRYGRFVEADGTERALAHEDVHRAYAGVTLPNPASVGLHEGLGFRRLAVYHEVGRKFGRYWDVLWLEKSF